MNDTPNNARAEAARRFSDIDGCPVAITQSQRDAFAAGAKWARESVLAQVRAGIEAVARVTHERPSYGEHEFSVIQRIDALAVLDRAATRNNEPVSTESGSEQ